ncbi:MAG TPA: hypothetical protein VMW42_09315, partial [Desulfatiglandales bacterium]|nr:hypothetical protein [Desulfatiglandales bacterium]
MSILFILSNKGVGFRCASTRSCGIVPTKAGVPFFTEKESVHRFSPALLLFRQPLGFRTNHKPAAPG